MSELHASVLVEVPVESIPNLLKRYLASLDTNVRGERNVTLPIPVAVIAVERVVLRKDHLSAGDGCEIMDVSWSNAAPYPPFEGTVKARAEDAHRTRLDLAGSYHPPFGIAGIFFDAALGHHRAQEALDELLATITSGLERLDRADDVRRTTRTAHGRQPPRRREAIAWAP